MTMETAPAPPVAVIAPVHPLVSGAAQFNTAMVGGLRELGPVQALSWRRLYPPIVHRRDCYDLTSQPVRTQEAEAVLDWVDPRSWRQALARVAGSNARALLVPWLHPVMAPPYRYLLRNAPAGVARVVICHNVQPHEPVPFGELLTRRTLQHADLLIVHASHQVDELTALGITGRPVLQAFHPRFAAADLCALPTVEQVARERARQGNPGLALLAFGAIRPYKGIDLALEALARVRPDLRPRLTVAGVFWDGGAELSRRVRALGIADQVELRDGFVSNEEAALLFCASDASLLPYHSATQSGVVQLSFAYGVPVIATAVGGLGEAVRHGEDGLLCPPNDVPALVAAIERMASCGPALAANVRQAGEDRSFRRYAELVHGALHDLRASRTSQLAA
jgi:glycosyltransferase involved in cell wall biosynthesis